MPEILKDKVGPQKQFHQHLDEGKFKIQRSKVTGEYFFHPRVAFPGTGDRDLEWVEVSGNGVVHSTTCNRRLPEKGGDFNFRFHPDEFWAINLLELNSLINDINSVRFAIGDGFKQSTNTKGY